MRLVCPNCGAQYEVDDRVIPDSGRDVQCSSCGHAWYQMPAGMEAAPEPLPDEADDGFGADDDTGEFEAEVESEPAPEIAAAAPATSGPIAGEGPEDAPEITQEIAPEVTPPEVRAEAGSGAAPDEDDEEAGPPPSVEGIAPPKRDLDQNLRAILQEEVAREMAARAADTGTTVIETPPAAAEVATPEVDTADLDRPDAETSDLDLIREPSKPLDDDFSAIGPAPTPERADVFAAAPDAGAAADKASRKDLFPDIEEINSTLDSHGLDDEEEVETSAEDRSGFGRAFFAVIAIAALMLAVYLTAPSLAARIPALEPALSAYVGAINSLRGLFTNLI